MAALHGAGGDVNGEGPWGFTPLMYATLFGRIEAVAMLIDWGADQSKREKRSQATAYELARRDGLDEIAELLWAKMDRELRAVQVSTKVRSSSGFNIAAMTAAQVEIAARPLSPLVDVCILVLVAH